MKPDARDPNLQLLAPPEKIGRRCRIKDCKMKPKFLDTSSEAGGYYCTDHYPLRINTTTPTSRTIT